MKREALQSIRVLACVGTLMAGTVPVLAAQEPEPYGTRSPSVARRRALLGTVIPVAAGFVLDGGQTSTLLVVGGVLLGPVLGYAYQGEVGLGMAQAGIRAAVMGGTVAGAILVCGMGGCDIFGPDDGGFAPAFAVLIAGTVATIVLTVRDIDRVGDRVQARNQRLAAVSVRPTYFRESRAAGLLVTWRH